MNSNQVMEDNPQFNDGWAPQFRDAMKIGRYLILKLNDGNYLFRQEGGEAATFKKEAVEKMITDFYLANF